MKAKEENDKLDDSLKVEIAIDFYWYYVNL